MKSLTSRLLQKFYIAKARYYYQSSLISFASNPTFLFIDLKSSTSILEKLGNDTYYSFLNDAIFDMSSAIIETKAEIYHYLGDESVFR